jgi:flagellin-specific chaperone FliS
VDERLTSEQGSHQDYEYRRQVTRKNESVKNKRIGKVHEIINTLHKQIDEDIQMS